MPSESHTKAAAHHKSAAKSHRSAAERHGKNDHIKGNEHAAEAQKHSELAGAASDEAYAKTASKTQRRRGRARTRLLFRFALPLFDA